jgi:glutamate racemase
MLERNIDTVVLGCTHYPFAIPLIREIVGETVRVIDPAPAVARQVERLLEAAGLRNSSRQEGEVEFYTSGDPSALKSLLPVLLGEGGDVKRVQWIGDTRVEEH